MVHDGEAVQEGLEERPHPRTGDAHGDGVAAVGERETRESLQGLVREGGWSGGGDWLGLREGDAGVQDVFGQRDGFRWVDD